eukprot:TRINITY_DN1561_c3_g1_i1.p1 TRINITY_DN1561_c3_g1~~TRINITY_DN1561_c3_g1_i1.p1  ORF type:complete len:259 (-),score=38.85 TRINITY_DN1561_c3_g1_i1:1137-1913(-)
MLTFRRLAAICSASQPQERQIISSSLRSMAAISTSAFCFSSGELLLQKTHITFTLSNNSPAFSGWRHLNALRKRSEIHQQIGASSDVGSWSKLGQASLHWQYGGKKSNFCRRPFRSYSPHCSMAADAPVEGGSDLLSKKKCVPCEGKGVKALEKAKAEDLLGQVPGWEIVEVDGVPRLRQVWKVRNFLKGLEMLQRVAEVAEAEGHHPDLHLVGWNNVTIDIWTHSIGGLHENDFILAAKIGALPVQDLVKKKKTSIA